MTNSAPHTISARELADRLGSREGLQVLDVRDDAAAGIEADGLNRLHRPASDVLSDPAAVATQIGGEVAVVCGRGRTAQPVAQALREQGVAARVLEGGMRAWIAELRPHAVDLGIPELHVRQVHRPGRGCLSYVLASRERALVVDPAPDPDFYLGLADELGAEVTDVVDTHLHADHLSGARELAARSGAALRLPERTLARGVTFAGEVRPLHQSDRLALGHVELSAIALPGHTTDMTGLVIGRRALLAGDSMFADGIARPDLQLGDPQGARAMAEMLHKTLRRRILRLGDRMMLLPGHTHPGLRAGAIAPTIGEVRAEVPELAIIDPGAFADQVLADMPPRPANYEAIIAANAGRGTPNPELESGANSCATR